MAVCSSSFSLVSFSNPKLTGTIIHLIPTDCCRILMEECRTGAMLFKASVISEWIRSSELQPSADPLTFHPHHSLIFFPLFVDMVLCSSPWLNLGIYRNSRFMPAISAGLRECQITCCCIQDDIRSHLPSTLLDMDPCYSANLLQVNIQTSLNMHLAFMSFPLAFL